jgi:type II secretory pathway pseudopilin PulG
VVLSSLNSARIKARDIKRRGDLKSLQNALELYYTNNNSYPSNSGWWGNCSDFGSFGTSGAGGWIPNLAPTYISTLPLDPKPNGSSGCYLYYSNGIDYKILAHMTMENSCPPMPSALGMYDFRSSSQCTIGVFTPGATAW